MLRSASTSLTPADDCERRRPKETALVVASSLALGTMGIIALILRGYSLMSASFIVVFVIPLLTCGVYLVCKGRASAE